jgi:hypothetical protein
MLRPGADRSDFLSKSLSHSLRNRLVLLRFRALILLSEFSRRMVALPFYGPDIIAAFTAVFRFAGIHIQGSVTR